MSTVRAEEVHGDDAAHARRRAPLDDLGRDQAASPGRRRPGAGVAPTRLTASAVAMNELAGTMTSSPRPDAQRAQREHERLGARGDADRVLGLAVGGEVVLERLDVGPSVKAPCSATLRDDPEQLLEQLRVGVVHAATNGTGVGGARRAAGVWRSRCHGSERDRRGRARSWPARPAARGDRGGADRGSSSRCGPGARRSRPASGRRRGAGPRRCAARPAGRRARRAGAASGRSRSSSVRSSAPKTSSAGVGAARAQVIDGGVVRQAQQPPEERHPALVVLDEHRHQLREDVLGDVLGLVLVAHDAADVAVDVVRVPTYR